MSAGRGIRTLVTPRDHKLTGYFAISRLAPYQARRPRPDLGNQSYRSTTDYILSPTYVFILGMILKRVERIDSNFVSAHSPWV